MKRGGSFSHWIGVQENAKAIRTINTVKVHAPRLALNRKALLSCDLNHLIILKITCVGQMSVKTTILGEDQVKTHRGQRKI